ncbi:MAG: putative ATP-binding cassette transporter [Saprospiraceae bacterium]|jgi:putative ATP-binding cassette transporter
MTSIVNTSSLARMLVKESPVGILVAVFFGLLAGFSYSLIIPIVMSAFSMGEGAEGKAHIFSSFTKEALSIIFFVNCLFIFIFRSVSTVLISYITRGAAAKLRVDLCKKIPRLPIASVERIEMPRIINILTRDIQSVAGSANALPSVCISILTIFALLAYVIYLSPVFFAVTAFMLAVGVAGFVFPMRYATIRMEKARAAEDNLQEGVRGLVLGIKELKLSKTKSSAYIDDAIVQAEHEILGWGRAGDAIMLATLAYGQLIASLIIGVITFYIGDLFPVSNTEIFGVIMVLLYILGPLSVILGGVPVLKMGAVSLGRISTFVEEKEEELCSLERSPNWKKVRLNNICYSYVQNNENTFSLKPISLELEKGSIYYIVGANGSGKSTLGKLLTLHYTPTEGDIYFDDVVVSNENRGAFRESISAIYSDYYLFQSIYGNAGKLSEEKIRHYLKYLGLEGKTEYAQNQFTTTKLSDGQRRRLALLAALLDDRDLYLFDEWAADQDPKFKDIFYREVLPDLKAMNKLVVIITHDDRYFDCADKLIFMEDGKIQSVSDQSFKGNKNAVKEK